MVLKYNSSCNYNSLGIMASMVSTYSWSQLIDMPLFTVCIVRSALQRFPVFQHSNV